MTKQLTPPKSVTVNGQNFPSFSAAARTLRISRTWISKHFTSKTPADKRILNAKHGTSEMGNSMMGSTYELVKKPKDTKAKAKKPKRENTDSRKVETAKKKKNA